MLKLKNEYYLPFASPPSIKPSEYKRSLLKNIDVLKDFIIDEVYEFAHNEEEVVCTFSSNNKFYKYDDGNLKVLTNVIIFTKL